MCERELETEQWLQHIDLPKPSGHVLVLLGCSTGGLGAQPLWYMFSFQHLLTNWSPNTLGVPRAPSAGWWLSLPHLVSDLSVLQLNRGSRGPLLLGGGFPYHIFSPTHWLPVSPSYIIIQSPIQSLEWHVWSSSSGNHCHAVHRSLSSGASVYECTMGFLPCLIFSAKPAYAISSHNCHRNVSLPSGASLWNGMFGQVEGQYTTTVFWDMKDPWLLISGKGPSCSFKWQLCLLNLPLSIYL